MFLCFHVSVCVCACVSVCVCERDAYRLELNPVAFTVLLIQWSKDFSPFPLLHACILFLVRKYLSISFNSKQFLYVTKFSKLRIHFQTRIYPLFWIWRKCYKHFPITQWSRSSYLYILWWKKDVCNFSSTYIARHSFQDLKTPFTQILDL